MSQPKFIDYRACVFAAEQSYKEIRLLKKLAKKHGYKVKKRKLK